MASLRQMKADGDIDLSFEIDSDTDGLSIDELQSQIDELEKAKVHRLMQVVRMLLLNKISKLL